MTASDTQSINGGEHRQLDEEGLAEILGDDYVDQRSDWLESQEYLIQLQQQLDAEQYERELLYRKARYETRPETEIGTKDKLQCPDVEIRLTPSRQSPIAGELWSMLGVVKNHADFTVWIVDTKCQLTVAPEIWGQTSSAGSVPAFFPTNSRPTDCLVRIDPGAEYAMVWKIDSYQRPEFGASHAWYSMLKRSLYVEPLDRIWNSIKNFAFFNPGEFTVSATLHLWTEPPTFDEGIIVNNTGESVPLTVTTKVLMEPSPWVLILGAVVGGLMGFTMQALTVTDGQVGSAGAGGFLVAILLTAITTILLSRLATTDFLIVVKVRDIWGAIATGFIVQWIGIEILQRFVPTGSESSALPVLVMMTMQKYGRIHDVINKRTSIAKWLKKIGRTQPIV